MFIMLKKTHLKLIEALQKELLHTQRYAENLLYKQENAQELLEELVEQINKKGGERFLYHAVLPEQVQLQFNQAEIRTLISLCHPDKHDGKQSATVITQKLLDMRK